MNRKVQENWFSRHTADLVQAFIWAVLVGLPAIGAWITFPDNPQQSLGFLLLMGELCGLYYLNYLLLVPRVLFAGRVPAFIGLDFSAVLAAIASLEMADALAAGEWPELDGPFWASCLMFYIVSLFIVFAAVAIRSLGRQKEMRRRQAYLEASHARAELSRLKNQLNPHFLFNSLNNISALSAIDPDGAQEAIGRLSAMLRYVLYDTAAPLVSLREEVEFMRHYIALMSLRYTGSLALNVDMELPPDALAGRVPPMLFISLVENAFKYGASSTEPSHIEVSLRPEPSGSVTLRVTNGLPAKERPAGHGLGLKNLQARLQLLFPGRHTLSARRRDGEFLALLSIPLSQPPRHAD